MSSRTLTREETKSIATRLGRHSLFFRTVWDLSSIRFTNEKNIQTAAIFFNKKDAKPIGMVIDETFWGELNQDERDFVIAHELCHVIFEHMKRYREFANKRKNQTRWNVGTDISINEMLVRQFGFSRAAHVHEKIVGGCWLDTVWPEEKVPAGKSSDFYIQKLIDENKYETKIVGVKGMPFDDHNWCDDEDVDEWIDAEELDNLIAKGEAKDFLEKLSDEQHKEMGGKKAGHGAGGSWKDLEDARPKKLRKWEEIIRHECIKALEPDFDRFETYFGDNPRMAAMKTDETLLPYDKLMIGETMVKSKVRVLLCLDLSGSCYHLANRFFSAARSIPTDRFIIDLIGYDTEVTKLNIKEAKVKGGGGTCFQCIEDYYNSLDKKPNLIINLTDGEASPFNCSKPNKWVFLMTPRYSMSAVPKGARVYELEKFE